MISAHHPNKLQWLFEWWHHFYPKPAAFKADISKWKRFILNSSSFFHYLTHFVLILRFPIYTLKSNLDSPNDFFLGGNQNTWRGEHLNSSWKVPQTNLGIEALPFLCHWLPFVVLSQIWSESCSDVDYSLYCDYPLRLWGSLFIFPKCMLVIFHTLGWQIRTDSSLCWEILHISAKLYGKFRRNSKWPNDVKSDNAAYQPVWAALIKIWSKSRSVQIQISDPDLPLPPRQNNWIKFGHRHTWTQYPLIETPGSD